MLLFWRKHSELGKKIADFHTTVSLHLSRIIATKTDCICVHLFIVLLRTNLYFQFSVSSLFPSHLPISQPQLTSSSAYLVRLTWLFRVTSTFLYFKCLNTSFLKKTASLRWNKSFLLLLLLLLLWSLLFWSVLYLESILGIALKHAACFCAFRTKHAGR